MFNNDLLYTILYYPPPSLPQSQSCTSPWWEGVNSYVGECMVGLCHQGWRPLAEEPPRALHEVERLTRNPEKLVNADARCWKDTLGRIRSFKTHQPPYPTRSHRLARDQETYRTNLYGQCQGGPEGETIENYQLVKRPKAKRSLEESCESLIVGCASSAQPTEER